VPKAIVGRGKKSLSREGERTLFLRLSLSLSLLTVHSEANKNLLPLLGGERECLSVLKLHFPFFPLFPGLCA